MKQAFALFRPLMQGDAIHMPCARRQTVVDAVSLQVKGVLACSAAVIAFHSLDHLTQ
jgi:hypothetical protein